MLHAGACPRNLRFLVVANIEHEGVDPTNNHAERELRAFVLWRKRSFGTQSARGNRFAERIMTVVHTCRKQARNVVRFVTRCYEALVLGVAPPQLLRRPPARAAPA